MAPGKNRGLVFASVSLKYFLGDVTKARKLKIIKVKVKHVHKQIIKLLCVVIFDFLQIERKK